MLTKEESSVLANGMRVELATMFGEHPESVVSSITCEDCPHNDDCEWAWDLYNTDGDCLAMK